MEIITIVSLIVLATMSILALVRGEAARREAAELRVRLTRLEELSSASQRASTPVASTAPVPASQGLAQPPMAPPAPGLPPVVVGQPVVVGPPVAASRPVVQPLAPPPFPEGRAASSRSRMNESFLGRKLLPLIAAALALIGLVFLGVLVVPDLPDWVKISLMFALSLAVGLLGHFLLRRRASILAQSLLGTGLGGVFIAILVTRVHFAAIGDLAVLALLGVWVLGSLWLAKQVDSLLVAILAQVGMVASLAYGYLGGLADDRLFFLLLYQVVTTAAIIMANLFWARLLYRFGLFLSQAMVIMSVTVMWHRFMGAGPGFASTAPSGLIAAAFLVQFVGATAIAYLLFVASSRVKRPAAAVWLAVFNALAWLVVLIEAVTILIAKLAADAAGLESHRIWTDPRTVTVSLAVSLVATHLPVLALALAARRMRLRPGVELGTVLPLAAVSVLLLTVNQLGLDWPAGTAPLVSWAIAVSAAYLLLAWLSGSPSLMRVARAVLGVDALLMLAPGHGYEAMTHLSVWASLGYLLLSLGLAALMWRLTDPATRRSARPWFTLLIFLATEVCLARILGSTGRGYAAALFVLLSAAALALLHFLVRPKAFGLFYRLAELAVILLGAASLNRLGLETPGLRPGLSGPGTDLADLRVGLILGSLALAGLVLVLVDRVRLAARDGSRSARLLAARAADPVPAGTPQALAPQAFVGPAVWPSAGQQGLEVISGLGLNLAVVGLLLPYDWFAHRDGWPWGYPLSLACMAVALVVVGLGLWSRVKPLRLYGLFVVIASVLKLVVADIGSVGSVTRVVAFLGGAAVCFGVSALYSFTAKRFDRSLAAPGDDGGPASRAMAAQSPRTPSACPSPSSDARAWVPEPVTGSPSPAQAPLPAYPPPPPDARPWVPGPATKG